MHTVRANLLKKVRYARVKPDNTLEVSEGIVLGEVVTTGNRVNVQVKDGDKIYNLEPYCIDATEEEEAAYLEHVKKLRTVVDEYNERSSQAIVDGNKAVDDLNSGFFGPSLEEVTH